MRTLPSPTSRRSPISALTRGGNIAFLIAFIASYMSMISSRPALLSYPQILVVTSLGLVFLWVGIWVYDWLEDNGSFRRYLAYFAFQIVLGGYLDYLGDGNGWLLLLPLVGQAVGTMPRLWTLGVDAAVFVAMLLPFAGNIDSLLDIAPMATSFLAAIVFIVIFTQITVSEQNARAEIERLASELGEANQKLREYAIRAEEMATAQERNRLAREIHDGLGHYLTAINMQIKAAQAVMQQDPDRAQDALGKAQTLAQEALADVRRSVAALRVGAAENRPLLDNIRDLVAECQAAGIHTGLVVKGQTRPLPPQTELALYRAVQEGLTNVRKHAQATEARVLLDFEQPGQVRLSVQDNGRGALEQPEGGFGLLGLRERTQLLGGQVQIVSRPGEGFRLEIKVPG